jgi:hypothetical protein
MVRAHEPYIDLLKELKLRVLRAFAKELEVKHVVRLLVLEGLGQLFFEEINDLPAVLWVYFDEFPFECEELCLVYSVLHVDKVAANVSPAFEVLKQEELSEKVFYLKLRNLSLLEGKLDCKYEVE